jgi:tetratricopeptide (TPR) repeat protein
MVDQEYIDELREKCLELSKQRKNKLAIECFDKILETNPNDFLSWREKGILLSYPKKPDKKFYLQAIECLNRALEFKEDDYLTLRQKAEVASKLKKWDQAIRIYESLLERNNGKDWKCWRGMGIAYADSGQPKKAIEQFDKALEINGKDVISLRRKGVALSLMGKDSEAIVWFEKALAITHRDCYNTLRDMGVSLRRIGRQDEAEAFLDLAIKKNSQNGPAWKEKGILLSQQGKDEEAIECFWKALQINEYDFGTQRQIALSYIKLREDQKEYEEIGLRILDIAEEISHESPYGIEDYQKYREKAFYHIKKGDFDSAKGPLEKALRINSKDALTHLARALLYEKEELKENALHEYYEYKTHAKTHQETRFMDVVDCRIVELEKHISPRMAQKSIERVLTCIMQNLNDTGKTLKRIEEIEEEFQKFLSPEKSIPAGNPSFFVVLRRWNSYTPLLPSTEEDSKGGGYFLYHRGVGLVIDPGINFIENFYHEGFTIDDIDAILITHAHIDHTKDFDSLLTLIYERNVIAKKSGKNPKKIYLFFNLGADRLYSSLDPRHSEQIHNPIILSPHKDSVGFPPDRPVMKITSIPAKHEDIVSYNACLGYLVDLGIAKIGLTGDTAWEIEESSQCSIGNHTSQMAQFFRVNKPDVMVLHLGSIYSEEFPLHNKKKDENKVPYFNKKHLGISGASLFLEKVKPRIVIISEFGEELREFRQEIVEGLKEGLSLGCCLAGDVGLYVQLHDLSVLTTYPEYRFVPFADVTFSCLPGGVTICYHKKDVDMKKLSSDELKILEERLNRKFKDPISKRVYY